MSEHAQTFFTDGFYNQNSLETIIKERQTKTKEYSIISPNS